MIEFTLGVLAGGAIVTLVAIFIRETQNDDWA